MHLSNQNLEWDPCKLGSALGAGFAVDNAASSHLAQAVQPMPPLPPKPGPALAAACTC